MTDAAREALNRARSGYRRFLDSTCVDEATYRLTPRADVSPYALCFAIFGLRLLNDRGFIEERRGAWNNALRTGLRAHRESRLRVARLQADKPYLQLLTFTLSALSIIGTLRGDPLEAEVKEILPADIGSELKTSGALSGRPRSGNHAMFMAIALIHARDYLGLGTQGDIETWTRLHVQSMNPFGYWGETSSMSHLQFQNGYHQYEILEYLDLAHDLIERAAVGVASLADSYGQFAPYPGGGGCYDYDAVFMLTGGSPAAYASLLAKTHAAIVSEQNVDGGFGESRHVRPRSLTNVRRSFRHVLAGRGRARMERLRYMLTLQRPKHDRIHTHWSQYSREWGESDLWDSWFRMLTLARIDCAFDPASARSWGFIDYPGIGFHPSIRDPAIR